jgi:transcription elongation factor GreA
METYLTKERLEELKNELEDLRTNARMRVADRLKRAKEFGDLSENAEYTDAKEEQEQVERRIFELEEMVKSAVIITKDATRGEVTIGSTVTLQRGKQVMKYTIVGSEESRPSEGKISNESPIGQALLRKKVGDVVSVKTPGGEVQFTVAGIE